MHGPILLTVSEGNAAHRYGERVTAPKTLILGLNFAPEPTGNAPYTTSLSAGLVARGFPVAVQTAHPHYPEWHIRDGYGGWTRHEDLNGVPLTRRRHYIPRRPRGLRRLLSELSFGLRLLVARWGRRDVTIAVSPALFSTWLASLRRGRAPFVVWVQDLYALGLAETDEGGTVAARVTRWVERWTLRSADRIVVVHDRFREYVVREFGIDESKVTVIRNWTHLPASAPIDRVAARSARSWGPDQVIALHAGNMGVKQGLENVIAAARLADARGARVRFVMLGGGGERPRLGELARGVESIEFIDTLPDAEFRAALAAADVLLVNEKQGVANMAVPSKLTSYFDAARPVVAATDPGGITAAEIKASGGGLIVNAADPAALLAAVIGLGADHAQADALGRSGRRYREDLLGERRALDRWQETLEAVMRGKQVPTGLPQ